MVKDCDPSTGEPDDEGYEDEYVVSNRIDPLSSMIHIQILQTDLSSFITDLVERICSKIKAFSLKLVDHYIYSHKRFF